jgi:hypothetical protein
MQRRKLRAKPQGVQLILLDLFSPLHHFERVLGPHADVAPGERIGLSRGRQDHQVRSSFGGHIVPSRKRLAKGPPKPLFIVGRPGYGFRHGGAHQAGTDGKDTDAV